MQRSIARLARSAFRAFAALRLGEDGQQFVEERAGVGETVNMEHRPRLGTTVQREEPISDFWFKLDIAPRHSAHAISIG